MTSRGQARRRALLAAAARLFTEKGFENTTLSDLVNEAGGSRATLYEYFGDKEGLLRAMMEEHTSKFLQELAALRPNPSMTPEEALTRMGLRFVQGLMDDEAIAMVRILSTEARRLPEMVEFFLRRGPDNVTARTAEYLQELADAGKLKIDDPQDAAHAFIGMVLGDMLFRRLMLPDYRLTEDDMASHVRRSVRIFLEGVRPRS